MTRRMQVFGAILVVGVLGASAVRPAVATIQDDDLICWYPDVETPTGCDENDD